MLRRKPTAITLTAEDLSSYEDRQAREAMLAAQAQAQAKALAEAQAQGRAAAAAAAGGGGNNAAQLVTPQRGQNVNPNVDSRQVPAVEKKKTRDERLGIAGRA